MRAVTPEGRMQAPPQNANQLWQWFCSVDTDRSGQISVQELQRALSQAGLTFSLALCAQMIRLHDRDFSRTINFQEFQQLHQFITITQQAFYHYDRDRSNSLTRDEVYNALQQAGFHLDRPAFEQLFKTFDPDGNQQLSMAEFMAMTVFLQSCSLTFQAFDPQRIGKVTLDFSQFIYAASNTR